MNDENQKNEVKEQDNNAGSKATYLLLKIIIFVFIVIGMGMCSVKFMS